MINLGSFSKYQRKMSHLNPIEGQLDALRAEKAAAAAEFKSLTETTLAKYSTAPVSEASVGVFGSGAWHSQPEGVPSPSKYVPPVTSSPDWVRRKWAVDHHYFGMLPASAVTKEAASRS